MASLVQKFKAFTDLSEHNISQVYTSLYVEKRVVNFHPNFALFADMEDVLVLEVTQKEVLTFVEFHEEYMHVSVSRNFTEHEIEDAEDFDLKYDATPEWLFQLSTVHDMGFIEGRYMKHLNKLHELYSTECE
ncbi:hypothetical protein GAP32_448 [Cronobacter phage vB_CsaM_GAP32]|uniref:Uncharacterized protein n=1 Tax=Cronobacter phage vB_CsaM_GAP32 TaxID=1141136 RepID=K4F781_9CAUD|nr:hypothetical protein GAP32_448 [Cronobacter phage vB_CsaM_GAP32]AFC21903.1 hypothetical protein GAP32_448 [Cronobacter phage vB_CsaM_GAP32]